MITNSYLKLFNLLKDFYELTNIKISIANGNRNELFVYPVEYSDFCEYIRNIDSVRQKCAECDIRAFEKCKNTKETQIYKCHAGLTECIIPIIVNFEISGYIFIGQIRDSDELIYKPEYALCDKTLLDKYFQKLIKIDRKKILCAIHVLEACAGYEQLQYFIINNQHNFHMQLESFIDNNIGEKLSVYALCNHMHVSRCELYREIKNEYDCTPADLIKNRRLNYAKHLLLTTDMPISKIAEKCGIGDYNYFSKVFKKDFNISPLKFRKINGKQQKDI